ncbi:ion transporter [Halorussus caseinilyticus]|uniref:ion transporter n=1 Tax=Halorussus caseinilyticus TaxID=3034025 RepID=UPI0023E76DE2|nr:ion transporter [Halorussus sp. DT72]
MAGRATPRDDRDLRESVRFYLLDHQTYLGMAIDVALLALNLAFVGIFVVETYSVSDRTQSLLWQAEVAITGVFLVEYVLRLYGARDRTAEASNPYTVVDLLSILPTLVVLLSPIPSVAADIGFLRVFRVVRVLRFYRFTKDEEFFFGTVEVGTLRAMKLLLTVLVVFFTAAGLFYAAENRANPAIATFGDAFYFTVVALSTVGFGDVVPVTRLGKWVTVSAILAGIILIPWQASRIVRAWTSTEKVDVTCPNCGLSAHDPDASHCKACGHVIYQEYEGDG